MSRPIHQQSADPKGAIAYDVFQNIVLASLAAAPTASQTGFAPGAIFIDSSGGVAYYNDGTALSTTWRAIGGIGDTNTWTGAQTFTGGAVFNTAGITITDVDIVGSATTGTKLPSLATAKLGFWGATPVVQPANSVDYVTMFTQVGLRATGGTAAASFPGAVTSSSPSGGLGFATGAGGVVTQGSNRSTGVTMVPNPCMCGAITTHNASLAAAAFADFVVTNSAVGANDTVLVSIKPGGTGSPVASVVNVAAGTFTIRVFNQHASTADTSADVINFSVWKGVTS